MASAVQVSVSTQADHLLAASTASHILLFDLRRPGAPLLLWTHPFAREPPHLLSLFTHPDLPPSQQRPSQQQHPGSMDSQAAPGSIRGCIAAANLGLGDGVLFSFAIMSSRVMLAALEPPEAEAAEKHRRRATVRKGFPGTIECHTGQLTAL